MELHLIKSFLGSGKTADMMYYLSVMLNARVGMKADQFSEFLKKCNRSIGSLSTDHFQSMQIPLTTLKC
jgi:hypothetical protein